jgi:hypothetical protein
VRGALRRNAWAAAGIFNGLQAIDWAKAGVELTLFHGHLIVHTEGVRSVQTAYPQAAVSGAIS